MKLRRLMIGACLGASMAALAPALAQDQAKAPPPVEPRMGTKPQEFLMTKITVSDLPKSYDFYTRILGLKLVTSPDMAMPKAPTASDPEKDFVEIPLNYSGSIADPMFLLIKRRGSTPTPEQANLIWLGFKVRSTQAVMETASQAGFKPTHPGFGDGRVGFIKDPDGYNVEILQGPSFESP